MFSLQHVDPPLANSLAKLQAYIPSDGIGSSDVSVHEWGLCDFILLRYRRRIANILIN
jgi:hypothetical protein